MDEEHKGCILYSKRHNCDNTEYSRRKTRLERVNNNYIIKMHNMNNIQMRYLQFRLSYNCKSW